MQAMAATFGTYCTADFLSNFLQHPTQKMCVDSLVPHSGPLHCTARPLLPLYTYATPLCARQVLTRTLRDCRDYGIFNKLIGREVDQAIWCDDSLHVLFLTRVHAAPLAYIDIDMYSSPLHTPHCKARLSVRELLAGSADPHARDCRGTRTQHIVGVAAALAVTDHVSQVPLLQCERSSCLFLVSCVQLNVTNITFI